MPSGRSPGVDHGGARGPDRGPPDSDEANDSSVEKLGELLNQNPRGLLLSRDELVGWLRTLDREDRQSDRAFYLEAWNGDNRFTYDRIGRGTVPIKACCLSVLGTIQPGPLSDYLRGALSNKAGNDGLIQRFQLAVYPDTVRAWRNVDRYPDTDAKNQAFRVFETLDHLNPDDLQVDRDEDRQIPFLRFDTEAQVFFDGWRKDLEEAVRGDDEHPAIVSHLTKYRSLMPSLSLLFFLANRATGDAEGNRIDLQSAEQAAAWCTFLEQHARRIYGQAIGNEAMDGARLILKRLPVLPEAFQARDIYNRGWTGLSEPDTVRRALGILADYGWVRLELRSHKDTGGRPGERWLKTPRFAEAPPS